MTYRALTYRGNYQLTLGADYSGAILSAEFGGGYRVDETIFPKLLYGKLTYSALLRRPKTLTNSEGKLVSRLRYVWDAYTYSKDNGNEPFVMRSPLDDKPYLWIFGEDNLEITLVDQLLATAGLSVRQVRVKGVATNADGSLDVDDGVPVI